MVKAVGVDFIIACVRLHVRMLIWVASTIKQSFYISLHRSCLLEGKVAEGEIMNFIFFMQFFTGHLFSA